MCSMFLRIFVCVCAELMLTLARPLPLPNDGTDGTEWIWVNLSDYVTIGPTGGAGPASRPIGRCEAANYIAAFGDAHKWIGFLVFPCHITPLPKKKQRLLKSKIYEVRCSINCNKSPKSTQQEGEAGGIGKKKMSSQSEGTLAASLLGTRKTNSPKGCLMKMFRQNVPAWVPSVRVDDSRFIEVYVHVFCGRSLEALMKSGRDFQSLMWQHLLQGDTCGKTEAIQVARRSATFDSEKLLLSKET